MLSSQITTSMLDATTVDYDLISQLGMKSVRAVAGQELDQPQELTISHEMNKSKTHTNTVVILDRIEDVGSVDLPDLAKARVQLKISYDHSASSQSIRDMVAEIKSVLTDATVIKLLNRES